jgi:hypothetical protein
MRLIPSSFNGFLFQQGKSVASDWNTKFDWSIGGITANNIPRSQNFPSYAAKGYSASIKVITVNFTNIDADRDSLVIAMDVLGEEQHKLYATDKFGRAWYVNAVCIGLNEEDVSADTAVFGAIFDVDDPIWKLATPSSLTMQTLYGTASGTIVPIGNQSALPVITITPTAGGGYGFSYKQFVTIINNSPNPLVDYPINLSGDAGWDTATIIGAGAMLSNGVDLRVYVDGVDVKRWFADLNTDHTKVWINLSYPANSNMTLGADIAGAGAITEIVIENTIANVATILNIPTSGNVVIGNELFVYTGVDIPALKLTGVTRAERETSEEAHTTGDITYFAVHDIWIYYGYAGIAPYVTDDTKKPVIDLSASTNTLHVYDYFQNAAQTMTAGWSVVVQGSDAYSNFYTGAQNTAADPADVMGQYSSQYAVRGRAIIWRLVQPCGILVLSLTGQKYASATITSLYTSRFNAMVSAGFLYEGTLGWMDNFLWHESVPSQPLTWEPLDNHSSVALAAGGREVLIFRTDTVSYINQEDCYCEIDEVTLELNTAKTPTVILSAIASLPINLHSVFSNSKTGDTMTVDLAMSIGKDLVIDVKNKTATLYDGTNAINSIQDMPVRAEWFELLPQVDNVITILEDGSVQYVFTWEDRSL